MIIKPQLLLEDKSQERFEVFRGFIIEQIAVFYKIPVKLITENYGKRKISKV